MVLIINIFLLLVLYTALRVIYYFHFRKKYDYLAPWVVIFVVLIVVNTYPLASISPFVHGVGGEDFTFTWSILAYGVVAVGVFILARKAETQRLEQESFPLNQIDR
jgi:hypothetical protein